MLNGTRQCEPVGDGGDFFGVLPRLLEQRELAFERDALVLLVDRHLHRQSNLVRQVVDSVAD